MGEIIVKSLSDTKRRAFHYPSLILLILACFSLPGITAGDEGNSHSLSIPSCAWERRMGDIPPDTISCCPDRGVALGGFGAGSFMYNISGSFGPWEMKPCDTRLDEFWGSLPDAAFHYYEKGTNDENALVKCLSTDANLKAAWPRLGEGEATYYALQPKGWVLYHPFAADVKATFYSPIIAQNYKETSYPVAVFEYELYNPSQKKKEVALMLTWPQVPYSTVVRKGYQSQVRKDQGITAVVLKAVHPDNTAETEGSEWCIATRADDGQVVTYVSSWNKDGSGEDVWLDFAEDGELCNKGLDDSRSAVALAVKVTLDPLERRRIPFVISWDTPVLEFASGTQWWRKYTEYFGRDGGHAFDIALEALKNYRQWEQQVDAWMAPFAENSQYPDWLKCAAFNELYYNQFGGVFYESGLKSGHDREFMGLHEDDHKHFVMENSIYRSANTLDVRHYSSIVFARFWPEIERDTLRCFADGAMHYQFDPPVPMGLFPHDVGDPTKCDPYFDFDVYRHDKPELMYWKDLSPKFIQQVWRYQYLYRDKEFLDYVWPACKAAYEFMKSTDTDGDFLPNNNKSDNTYDDWGLYGTSLLCGGLWVGCLEAMEKMAGIEEDPILPEVREWLKKAKVNLDEQLWYDEGGYYKIDTESAFPTAIMADGLNGQRYCEVYGLGDILPSERMSAHLRKVYEMCVKPMPDYTGDGIGDVGAINGVKEDGRFLGTLQSDEVWTGSSYFLASLMYHAGLKKEALQTAWGVYYITYKEDSTAFWFNTPESWRIPGMQPRPSRPEQYQRPRAIWELVFEINDPTARDTKASVEKRVEDLLQRMTLEEKVSMLSGASHMDTRSIERLGIPSLKMADGPHGVRLKQATCFPTGVSMGACWNTGLVTRVGVALGREARAKGRNLLLGPCVNIHRTPLGGRNFESFSEDPYLTARTAVAYVKGVQSQKIGTSTKHFACNNQEWARMTINAEVGERALREIYLPAFKAAVQEADSWSIMGAYNKVNGSYCCENPPLLSAILKNEWGFKGLVVSDWWGCHSTVESAHAGLDLEMPGPGPHFTDELLKAVKDGEVSEDEINDKVSRILWVMFSAGLFDGAETRMKGALNTPEHRALARELAQEAIVLLKNEGDLLPLREKAIRTLAVIGPNAADARLGGGGSSTVDPFYSVSPLQGLKDKIADRINIRYARGCLLGAELLAIGSEYLIPPKGSGENHGLCGEYFSNAELAGDPVLTRIDNDVAFTWGGNAPASLLSEDHFSVRWTGKLVPPKTGTYELGMTSDDGMRLYLDEKLVVEHWSNHGPETRAAKIDLSGGQEYDIRIEYYESIGDATAKLGWIPPGERFEKAVNIAGESDAVIVFVGLSSQVEGEGVDRATFEMPPPQAELIQVVAKANSNIVVVLINGTPVPMNSWIENVPAVVEAWYPGQEGGNAIANVLFGDVNPSGKLPTTFPTKLEDNPSFGNYPGEHDVVRFAEGLFVGYRHYDKNDVEPLFPFGHGLSYTSFKYDNLDIRPAKVEPGSIVEVSVDIENTGQRAGKEVVQLYVRDIESSLERPLKELKGFEKVHLNPGEKKTVKFILDEAALSFYDPARKGWVAEPGVFEVLMGGSSRDIRVKGSFDLNTKGQVEL